MKDITEAFNVLFSHRTEMETFMDYYVFKKMKINKDTFLNNEKDFLLFVKFCLNTAQRSREKNINDGLNHFKMNYTAIKKMIENKNINQLKNW